MNDIVTREQGDSTVAVAEEWSLTVEVAFLKQQPGLAALMLRLGAAVNAIRSVQRWTIAFKDASTTAGERDRIWSFLVSVGYLKEAIDGLLKPHYRTIVQLARKDGTPEDVIRKLGALMSTKPHDLYKRVLVNARNNLVFHWEEGAFQHWVEENTNPTVAWVRGTGETEGEVVFTAAMEALLDSLIPGVSEAEIPSRVNEVAEASGLLVGVFQRAIHAYFVDSSIQSSRA